MGDDDGRVATMLLVGGDISLDFVNTGSQRLEGPFQERLVTYGDLVAWAVRTGALDRRSATRVRADAARHAAEAARVLERGRALREALYRLFTWPQVGAVAATDVDLLNGELVRAFAQRRLAQSTRGLAWSWTRELSLDRVLGMVAAAAADLLTAGEIERVKECGGVNCNWLFRDTSRNGSRRWCDMRECGNRSKARRYYARHRHEGA